ncbi:hypothetical protein GWI33_021280 [Rhynchophorus ferrugineus]|uniref:Uncharacterized protein n=1 Tax=Rhynchophorus ferrugineus TaxID=354439 RepID=A0A834LZR8_RHYFE|nr:hypothetical protein GWI33_021280 [Rhynchophorus ferrugineus]
MFQPGSLKKSVSIRFSADSLYDWLKVTLAVYKTMERKVGEMRRMPETMGATERMSNGGIKGSPLPDRRGFEEFILCDVANMAELPLRLLNITRV